MGTRKLSKVGGKRKMNPTEELQAYLYEVIESIHDSILEINRIKGEYKFLRKHNVIAKLLEYTAISSNIILDEIQKEIYPNEKDEDEDEDEY
jgi:hypothetical protein